MMELVWVLDLIGGVMSSNPASLLQSPFPSVRYRVALPARELGNAGIECRIASPEQMGQFAADAGGRGARAVIFSKLRRRAPAELAPLIDRYVYVAEQLKSQGVTVVFDVCDNYFADETQAAYFSRMCALADVVTVNSEAQATNILQHAGRTVHVIPDPVEGAGAAPHVRALRCRRWWRWRYEPVRVLWFGARVPNFVSMANWLRDEMARPKPYPLHTHLILPSGTVVQEQLAEIKRRCPADWRITTEGWSPSALSRALATADVVALPADTQDVIAATASANRLLESIWAGVPVIANPIPSYLEFEDAAWIGASLHDGLVWRCNHAEEAAARVLAGQAKIRAQFTPAAVALRWREVLGLGA